MSETKWAEALDVLRRYAFKLETPQVSGTGFILTISAHSPLYGIATAFHVIDHAFNWEEPIKLTYAGSFKQCILRKEDRFIFADPLRDIAIVMFFDTELGLPREELAIIPEDRHLKQGIPIGWAGFPAVAPREFSFFSGTISCFLPRDLAYLVDGVAINGVSGGPAFTTLSDNKIDLAGVVSAYIPNRATGESLPGVCFVVGMHSFYQFFKDIRSLDEAKEKKWHWGAGSGS